MSMLYPSAYNTAMRLAHLWPCSMCCIQLTSKVAHTANHPPHFKWNFRDCATICNHFDMRRVYSRAYIQTRVYYVLTTYGADEDDGGDASGGVDTELIFLYFCS